MIEQRFEAMESEQDPDEERDGREQGNDGSEQRTRVRQRPLSREEWRGLDRSQARADAEYLEIGWRKTARESLGRIHQAIDELRDAPVQTKRPKRHPGRVPETTRRIPAGLRSRVSEELGPVAYVQLAYTTKEHHVCRVGLRDGTEIEDVVALVGPDRIRLAEDIESAVDQLLSEALERARQRAEASEGEAADTPEPPASELESWDNPFGRVYEIEEIEGIGDTYGEELADIGVFDTRDLWFADTDELSEAVDRSPDVIRRWQAMAELMAISGIGPQYAELLARSGVSSIEGLANADADELLEAVEAKQAELEVRIQGNIIGEKTIQNWIDLARNHTA